MTTTRVRTSRPLIAFLLASLASPALAAAGDEADANEALVDRAHRFTLTLDKGWDRSELPEDSTTPFLGFSDKRRDALLAVARVDYPNAPAWRSRTRDAYHAEVERGVRDGVTDYKRLKRRTMRLGIVPAMDLVFRHRAEDGDEVVFMRFLFFRRYTLSLSVSVPQRSYKRHRRSLERLVRSFKPFLED